MIRCPNCDWPKTIRYRDPVVKGPVVFRRHRCTKCKRIFLSFQMAVISRMAAEELLAWVEANPKLISSSARTPSDLVTSLLTPTPDAPEVSGPITATSG